MTPEQMELVAEARAKAAILFRTGKPGWDRPDSPGDPWYNPEEWDDEGNYYGPPKNMMPVPIQRETDTVSVDTPETDTLLNDVKAMLEDGLSIREIASNLGITAPKVQRLKAKLKLSD